MKRRLLDAIERNGEGAVSLGKRVRDLVFAPNALEDLTWWVQTDRKKALRLLPLLEETLTGPFGGIGKPEPLKHEYAGCWSKRIDDEHRLVYRVKTPKREG